MPCLVTDITVSFSDKQSSSFATGAGRTKPRAEVSFMVDGDDTHRDGVRKQWVPPRVARAFLKDLPAFPCEYETASAALDGLEKKLCLIHLTEMLGRRDYGRGEAERKLALSGFRPTAITFALERAKELNFLSEERFLASYIEERIRRGWGRRKIEADLRSRGSDPHELPGYPDDFFSPEDDLERACALLKRKSIPKDRAFERFVRHLMAKGFSYDVASRAARARLEDEAEEPDTM